MSSEPFSPLGTVRCVVTFVDALECSLGLPCAIKHTHMLQCSSSPAGGAALQLGQDDLERPEDLPHQHSNPDRPQSS